MCAVQIGVMPRKRSKTTAAEQSSSHQNATEDEALGRIRLLEQQMINVGHRSTPMMTLPVFEPTSKYADPEGWCAIVDMWVTKYQPDEMTLVMALSNALKGESASWLISAKPTEKSWPTIRAEFLAVFEKPIDPIEQFAEAVNGKPQVSEDTPLIDEMLNSMRIILGLLKNRRSDEEFAVLVACYFGSTKNSFVRRQYQSERPKDAKEMCTMLQGRVTKRSAPFPSGHHTGWKRRAVSPPTKNDKTSFQGKCHKCGRVGHRAAQCRSSQRGLLPRTSKGSHEAESKDVICFKCRKPGHIAPNCTDDNRKAKTGVPERRVNLCERSNLPEGTLKLKSGEIFPFLFDTGSDCSLVKEAVAHHLDGKRFNNVTCLKGVGCGSFMCCCQILTTVEVGQLLVELLFYVVPEDFMSANVVIGKDLIEQQIRVEIGSDGLKFTRELNVQLCEQNEIDLNTIDTDVNLVDKQPLISLLSKYLDNFVIGVPKTRVKTGEFEIRLRDPNKLVQRRPYRLAPAEREIVRAKMEQLLNANIIRPSSSPYSSPILLVKKKDGTDRVCVDFRELNSNTVADNYPLPLISDQINRLHGAFYFTSLDMAAGFHQIPVHPNSIEKTSFVTPDGKFEYLTMPFGVRNGPSVYQRCIDKALGDLRNNIAVVYIDDVLIPSSSIVEGLERLEIVMTALAKAGFSFNLQKCKFLKSEIEYLGYLVKSGKIRPNPRKTAALVNSAIPKTSTQVRQFLGLASYFRQFIKNFSRIAAPLYRLTASTTKKIEWTSKHDEARNTIIQLLTSEPVLAIFDPNLPIELHTDASSDGYGAVLFNKRDGKLHPVAYFSKRTTEPESRYHSYELETLAVVNAVKHFRHFLVQRHFIVVTDCNSLKASRTKRDLTPRAHRWWAFLQAFDFDILYRDGKRMKHADFFSRNPPQINNENVSSDSTKSAAITKTVQNIDLYKDWLAVAQQRDSEINKTVTALRANELDPDIAKTYDIRNNILYRKIQRNHRSYCLPVVPNSMAWTVINHVHTDLKHLGWEKTLEKIYELYWFPHMSRTVRKFVDNCLICKTSKNKSGKSQIQMHPIAKVSQPWHTIHVDISGKLTGKSDTKEYVFVIIDAFTKFVFLKRINSLTADCAINCLKEFTYLFGAPVRIISDQGKCFTSSNFREFCTNYNVELHLIAHCTSRANGQVERVMQTLKNTFTSIETESDKTWQDSLGEVQLAINSTKHKVTGFSPAELLFGVSIRSLELRKITCSVLDDTPLDFSAIRTVASEKIVRSSEQDVIRKNALKATVQPFSVGDFVFSKSNERMISKLDRKYRGPFKIVKVLDNDRYELVKPTEKGKGRTFKFAHDQLIAVPEAQGDISVLPDISSEDGSVSAE